MEAAYIGVNLWSKAVQKAKTTNIASVLNQLKKIVYLAPEGLVKIDSETQHTWKSTRIGKVLSNGQFDIIWESKQPIKPAPYPNDILRNQFNWDAFTQTLFKKWGNKWSA